MPGTSSISTIVSARVAPNDAQCLREIAAQRGTTLSALLASMASEGVKRMRAA